MKSYPLHTKHRRSPIRVLALTRKPNSPSFEQRIVRFMALLREKGIQVVSEKVPKKYPDRWRLFRKLGRYDIVWLHKHLPSFPEITAWRFAKKKLVYDFDDPVFASSSGPSATRRFRFSNVLRSSDLALTSNEYLAGEARPFCRDVRVVPMAIDLPELTTPLKETGKEILLLWLGSRATIPYLREIQPVLDTRALSNVNIRLRIVSHDPVTFNRLKTDFRRWSPEEERRALNECHIGLCPMPDNTWTRGKSPYKILQYMAYGLPWIGSPVGENRLLAGNGEETVRGFLASGSNQWVETIKRLAGDDHLRHKMGREGRQFVEQRHDRSLLASQLSNILRTLLQEQPNWIQR